MLMKKNLKQIFCNVIVKQTIYKILLILLMSILYSFIGIYLEANKIIIKPACFAFYGFCFGAMFAIVTLNFNKR